MKYLLFFLFCLAKCTKSWTPLCSIRNLDRLHTITVDKKDYIVGQTSDKKIVVQDTICLRKTYPTYKTGDILWVDFLENNSSLLMVEKENMFHVPCVRNIDCSWNLFLEYCMDLTHFGSNGTQAQLLEMNPDILRFFVETSENQDLKIEYISPYLFQISDRFQNEWKCFIQILCIPIRSGQTKIMICDSKNHSMNDEKPLMKFKLCKTFFENFDYEQQMNSSKGFSTNQTSTQKMMKKWIFRYYPKWIS